ncbi:hypothetical protein RHI9324_05503 [Rhizobium sp. CECT 9324]|nr:hypothetical protein RHI9324_04047 [Rhizobium sp. CECT 9324]CAH0343765.1 hypothetical protein RHI9324_05503 [Rhizobium sp. CECT 9324]
MRPPRDPKKSSSSLRDSEGAPKDPPHHSANHGASTVTKLINAYRKVPTPTNRARLQKYLEKHPMAVVMATKEEAEFLKTNDFRF